MSSLEPGRSTNRTAMFAVSNVFFPEIRHSLQGYPGCKTLPGNTLISRHKFSVALQRVTVARQTGGMNIVLNLLLSAQESSHLTDISGEECHADSID